MREMRESGTPWIGEMPSHWPLIRFKDKYKNVKEIAREKAADYERLALTLNGVIKRPKDDSEGLQPKEFDTYQILRENDFVFKMIDLQNISTSRVGLSPYTGLVSPAYIRFTPKTVGHYNKFVYYYLMSLYYNCVYNNLGGDGVRSALSASDMGEFVIPYPSEEEQKTIAEFLDKNLAKVDTLIANVQAQIEKLKAYKQSLITEVVTKGLEPNVPMKDSGVEWIGEIPVHWTLWRIGDIGDFKKGPFGSAVKKEMFVEKGPNTYKVYEQKNAIYKDISLGYYYLSQEDYDRLETFSIQSNDIIVSCAGTIGEAYIVPDNYEKGIINQALMRIRLNERLNAEFFIYVFSCIMNLETPKYSNGSAMKNIPPFNYLLKFLLPCPPEKEQMQIVEYISKKSLHIDRLIAIKEAKIEKLEQYKKSLIYEYVTGKKQVEVAL